VDGGCVFGARRHDERRAAGGRSARKGGTAVNLDPNTHAYVLGTAFFTSLFFALGAWLPVGLVLRALVLGE
jgi:hypothetical protein